MRIPPICLLLLIAGLVVATGCTSRSPERPVPVPEPAISPSEPQPSLIPAHETGGYTMASPLPSLAVTTASFSFGSPKKAAHYESNTPAHAEVLAGVPVNIVINFNFDLHPKSSIRILKEEKDYGTGPSTVDTNKLTLRRSMDMSAIDGLYTVEYATCWPDGSCHDGSFRFAIDRSLQSGYSDMRNRQNVTILIKDFAFVPASVIVSPGTAVTWINGDPGPHSVNTDSHPAHTYYPAQNSRVFGKDDTYTAAFAIPGIYLYHCSVHPDMVGSVLVR